MLWILCFLVITLAIDTVWDKVSGQEPYPPARRESKTTPSDQLAAVVKALPFLTETGTIAFVIDYALSTKIFHSLKLPSGRG